LNDYYNLWNRRMSMGEIVDDIYTMYEEFSKQPVLTADMLMDFESIKDKVIYKLVNYEKNRELLSSIINMAYLDFAIIFCIHIDGNENGEKSILITDKLREKWDVEVMELYDLAIVNTERIYPCTVKSMHQVMIEMFKEKSAEALAEESLLEELETNLYVMTNTKEINGATCIIYKGALHRFAEEVGSNLIILPSSIHEVILLPDKEGLDYEELKGMVESINENTVPIDEVLSNQIYRYDSKTDSIKIME
ncbi:MAG: DUF5688 family protein, partial [Clostridium sp.]